MPTRSFGLVDFKVSEAEYFLAQLTKAALAHDWHPLHYCVSAFVASARSVTFAMQAALKDHPDFSSWYAPGNPP